LKGLEDFLTKRVAAAKEPFTFKMEGTVREANYHVVNLPLGSVVTDHESAHVGQVNFTAQQEKSVVLGYYSQNHRGIFTHHDTYLHAHWMNEDRTQMGHLESLVWTPGSVRLWIQSR
jgi:acetolactate decarboxylase